MVVVENKGIQPVASDSDCYSPDRNRDSFSKKGLSFHPEVSRKSDRLRNNKEYIPMEMGFNSTMSVLASPSEGKLTSLTLPPIN